MLHRAAVIGKPVAHSLSPVLHRAAYESLGITDWLYDFREIEPEDLAAIIDMLRQPEHGGERWEGLSVTMPHKQRMMPMLDVIDPLAQVVGAANTVVAQHSGSGRALLAGFNTDVAGIVGAFRDVGVFDAAASAVPDAAPDPVAQPSGSCDAVILGSGATACSSLAALTELGATRIAVLARTHAGPGRAAQAAHRMGLEITQVHWDSRDAASNMQAARFLAGARFVVSTLPSGAADVLAPMLNQRMSGADSARPVLLDVVYDPWPTPLAAAWEACGGLVAPGWLMLLHQAVPQVQLMTGRTPSVDAMRAAVVAALDAR